MSRVLKYHPRRDILLNSANLVKVMVLSCLPRALQMFKNCLSCDEGSKPLCVSFDKNQVSQSGGNSVSESIYILDNLSLHAMVIKCVLVAGPGGGQGEARCP